MIDEVSASAEENDEFEGPSKSQLKRDAHAVRDMGAELAALSTAERARIPLPDDIVDAIEELNRTTKNGARKRQLGWLAKRMRQIEVAPIEQALDALKQTARANTQSLHLVEQWRSRLLGDIDGEAPKEALTAFLDRYPTADRQQLRQLQRSALAEREANKPPKASRLLFKLMRDSVVQASTSPQ